MNSKYKVGDKFLTTDKLVITVLSVGRQDYYCKVGCCRRHPIKEETLNKLKLIEKPDEL